MAALQAKSASIIDGTGKPARTGHLMADGNRIRHGSINERRVVRGGRLHKEFPL